MTTCAVCGGDRFSLQDGFYHCDECGTQSQEVREMVVDDTTGPKGTVARRIVVSEQTLATRKKRKLRRKQIKQNAKQVWLTDAEKINILLQKWSQLLQAAGAPVDLPEKMLQLWAYCLAKIGPTPSSRLFTVRSGLVLLWIALAECDERYLLSDVLRWAREGIIPVYSAPNEMPEDARANFYGMFYCSWQGEGFRLLPCVEFTERMLRTLDLPKPRLPSLESMLSRLLEELALPQQLATIASNLARRVRSRNRLTPEVYAAALILLSLKLLLGLDGVTELANSRVAAARNAAVADGHRWFDFSEWLQHHRESWAAAILNHYPSLAVIGDPDPCQLEHRRLIYDFFRNEGVHRHRLECDGREFTSKRDFLVRTVSLFGREPAISDHSTEGRLLQPLSSRLPPAMLIKADTFRQKTLGYLTDRKHVEELASVGLEVKVIQGSARRRRLWCRPKEPSLRVPADVVLLDRAEVGDDPPEPPARGGSPPHSPSEADNTELRLFLPSSDVWLVGRRMSSESGKLPGTSPDEIERVWPATFNYLIESLAALVELRPLLFARIYANAEADACAPIYRDKSFGGHSRNAARWHRRMSRAETEDTDSD